MIRFIHLLLVAYVLPCLPSMAAPTDGSMVALSRLVYTDLDLGFEESRITDVISVISDACNTKIVLLANGPHRSNGIDPDTLITLTPSLRPALNLLQDAIAQCGVSGNCTWQIRHGIVEVSTKSALSTQNMQETRILPIEDLLQPVPDYNDPPNLNLGSGGGGSGAPGGRDGTTLEDLEIRRNRLIELLISQIEPLAWRRSGGTWASIEPMQRSLVIRAPRWIHRQITGFQQPIPIPEGSTPRQLHSVGADIRVEIPLSERLRRTPGSHS